MILLIKLPFQASSGLSNLSLVTVIPNHRHLLSFQNYAHRGTYCVPLCWVGFDLLQSLLQEPEFKFPDSSTDQWSTTPSFNEDDRENVGEGEGRLQTDKRRPGPGNNGSSRLRSIDGSGYSDKSYPILHEGRSESL